MKVVLIKDVRDMGPKGSIQDVSAGHAMNFLIPQKMAISAVGHTLQTAQLRQKQVVDKQVIDADLLSKNVESLKSANIVISMKVNDKGHLYESVGESEILAAVKAQTGIDLPEHSVTLEKSIKEVGTFEVVVRAGKDFGAFSVTVEAAA